MSEILKPKFAVEPMSDKDDGSDVKTIENDNKIDPEKTRQKYQQILSKMRPELASYSGDASIDYIFDNSAETFYYSPEGNKVAIPDQVAEKLDYDSDQVKWCLFHELSHFIDMRKNPDRFLEEFDFMKAEADKLAQDIKDGKIEIDGLKGKLDKINKNQLKKGLYTTIHTLYNVLDDVYVNNLVRYKAGYYRLGNTGQDKVADIYHKIGYAEPDYSQASKSKQMIFPILRDEMLPDEDPSIVGDEIDKMVNKKIVLGQSLNDLVQNKLKPNYGLVDPEKRYDIIRKYFLPKYKELLIEDLQKMNFDDPPKQENQSGEGGGQNSDQGERSDDQTESGDNQSSGQGEKSNDKKESEQGSKNNEKLDNQNKSNESKDANEGKESDNSNENQSTSYDSSSGGESHGSNSDPNQILNDFFDNFISEAGKNNPFYKSPEQMEKTIRDIIKTEKENNLSRAEKAQRDVEKKQRQFDQKFNIKPETRRNFNQIINSLSKPRLEMVEFWNSLVGESYDEIITKVGHQKKGNLNAQDFIKQYPQYLDDLRKTGRPKKEFYDRQTYEYEKIKSPELIEISLIVDNSASMGGDRIYNAQLASVLLLTSIKDFNQKLEKEGFKLRINTEAYVFGSDYQKIKKFSHNETGQKAMADIIKSVSFLDAGSGGTSNAGVLSEVLSDLQTDPQKNLKLKQGKVKKLVFEITDGEPSDENTTKANIEKLRQQNVELVSFLVGSDVNPDNFSSIWGENGIVIGSDVNKLPSMLMKKLKKSLGSTGRIK